LDGAVGNIEVCEELCGFVKGYAVLVRHIKVGDDTIGGIATAGAPGGDKDEACAVAGLNKIKDRLN
jgi:uncharacterized protein GlcG (DUF336 family)